MTDRVTELLEEFERSGRTGEPAPDVHTALAATTDVVLDRVLDHLESRVADLAAGPEPDTARAYAAALDSLAELLDEADARALRAWSDVVVARVDIAQGRWDDAPQRLFRARPGIAECHPELLGDCEALLGETAWACGDAQSAREHWDRARRRHRIDGRHRDAAVAAGRMAATYGDEPPDGGDVDPAVVDLWIEAADGFTDAGEPETARLLAANACRWASWLFRTRDDADFPCSAGVAATARDVALRHDLRVSAAEFAVVLGFVGVETGRPWEEVLGWFDHARADHRAAGPGAGDLDIRVAAVDLAEGNAAAVRGRLADAREPLSRAAAVYRVRGMAEHAGLCEQLLVIPRECVDAAVIPESRSARRPPAGSAPPDPG